MKIPIRITALHIRPYYTPLPDASVNFTPVASSNSANGPAPEQLNATAFLNRSGQAPGPLRLQWEKCSQTFSSKWLQHTVQCSCHLLFHSQGCRSQTLLYCDGVHNSSTCKSLVCFEKGLRKLTMWMPLTPPAQHFKSISGCQNKELSLPEVPQDPTLATLTATATECHEENIQHLP